MALKQCPDCGKDVSTSAPACPGCGAPMTIDRESRGSGVRQLTTTQETSKSLKLQQLLSALMLIVGFAMIFISSNSGGEPNIVAGFLILIGVVWYIATRARIWWHHK